MGEYRIDRKAGRKSGEAQPPCKVIEEYLQDAPLPSYLVFGRDMHNRVIHVVVAIDEYGENLRIITSYRPTLEQWEDNLKTRKK